jgi:N utilization substance protein B
MLNRRILRSKALQCLYAYYRSKEANYNLALDYINDQYLPDLNSMEPVDKSVLDLKKRESLKIFQINFKHDSFDKLKDSNKDIEVTAYSANIDYVSQNHKDFKHFKSLMLRNVEQIYNLYIWILMIPDELISIMQNDESGKLNNSNKRFIENQIVQLLRNNNRFQKSISDNKLSWNKEKDLLYNWFKNVVNLDLDYKSYIKEKKEKKDNFTSDIKLLLHLFKDLLFKNEAFHDFMESEDLNWNEDRNIVKSMIVKTFKKLDIEDRDIDLIGEMIYFPSIPVKVSINEYIELSKNFSTPKSKKFVNGILDVLSEELIQQGKIKKSGRGLIDNK